MAHEKSSLLIRLAQGLPRRHLSWPGRYALAALVVLVCMLLRLTLPVMGLPYLLFIPVLMGIGFILGLGPGLFATLLVMVAAAYLFVGEPYSLALTAEQWTASGLFTLVNGGIVAVCAALQRSLDRLHGLTITLRQRVAARTRERDQIWEASPDLICTCSLEGRLLRLNPAWQRVLGWRPEAITRMSFLELVHPDDVPSTCEALEKVLQGEVVLGFENRYRHAEGGYRWLSWSSVRSNDCIYSTVRDVTGEKDQAEALRKTEELLRQSQKMEAVGQLTGGLAHDFNNLLAGISGSLELMQQRLTQGRHGEIERYVAIAQNATNRAAALTHRLLAFSRRQTLDPRPTQASRLVADMLELVDRTVGPGIRVEAVLAEDLWHTACDPGQLESALLNLCINARDAMPDGGCLTIATSNLELDADTGRREGLAAGQYVVLSVSDEGIGMSPEVAARAFEPFFTTKPTGMGTGLGLSMIYGFAQQSGGQAIIDSTPGQGSRVRILLPRSEDSAASAAPEPAIVKPPRARDRQTVLVVDDEAVVRALVVEVLEELGYAVREAADGPAGLRIVQSGAPLDLLVSDVGLPGGMNGRQLADAARQARPGLKVLFITGYAENAVVGSGNLEPGMHLMTKPFALDRLAVRIEAIMSEHEGLKVHQG